MLVIAGISVVVVTALEILLLVLFPNQTWARIALLSAGNLILALVVGYLVFNRGTSSAKRRLPVNVVQDTLPHLRQGLNPESASQTARIVGQVEHVLGVLITEGHRVLASTGDDFADNSFLQAAAEHAADVVRTGTPEFFRVQRPGLPQHATLLGEPITPQNGKALGAIVVLTLAEGAALADVQHSVHLFAQVVAMQVELGQLDRQAHLVAEAELNALRAQINPHFLFNALNTIVSYSREDPETTRRLLIRLADLFRNSIHSSGQMVSFQEEYHNLKNYLFIEQARFQGKLHVVYDIDPQVLKVNIPALSVQPLVENAVRHGISKKAGSGTLVLKARLDFLALRIVIEVIDDGVGMTDGQLAAALAPRALGSGRGVGLSNINERLKRLYGESYRLRLESTAGKGTTATLRIPMR